MWEEGSPMLSLEADRHRGSAAAKVHGGALILDYCKEMAHSGITNLLQETSLPPSPSIIFPM